MKIQDFRENYYYFSGEASKIVRNLGFAGIAVIWIFRNKSADEISIPYDLIPIGLLILNGLILDFLQYVYAAAAWGIFCRMKERQQKNEEKIEKEKIGLGGDEEWNSLFWRFLKENNGSGDFEAPKQINWPTLTFFWLKIILMAIAYALLIIFFWNKLT